MEPGRSKLSKLSKCFCMFKEGRSANALIMSLCIIVSLSLMCAIVAGSGGSWVTSLLDIDGQAGNVHYGLTEARVFVNGTTTVINYADRAGDSADQDICNGEYGVLQREGVASTIFLVIVPVLGCLGVFLAMFHGPLQSHRHKVGRCSALMHLVFVAYALASMVPALMSFIIIISILNCNADNKFSDLRVYPGWCWLFAAMMVVLGILAPLYAAALHKASGIQATLVASLTQERDGEATFVGGESVNTGMATMTNKATGLVRKMVGKETEADRQQQQQQQQKASSASQSGGGGAPSSYAPPTQVAVVDDFDDELLRP